MALANILGQLPKQYPGWNLGEMFLNYVETRLTGHLQSTQFMGTAHGKVKVRIYECYPVGKGPRRWQRLKGMTANDLRVCISARRVQVAGHLRVIRVYEKLLELLDSLGPTAKVQDVYEQALDQAAVELASSS